ncbi:MAG: bifunctional 2-polyprenyl-6-hydroxyphenol methylase/3-demethylubiquinol 3-O-methyltransferase UbiG, partial [Alphaproteobacteria bacterium]
METIDQNEVDRFRAIASEWWNPTGKFRPLHDLNPARLEFMRDQIAAHFDRDARAAKPFTGISILDVGCGGGLISEPLARLGATVTGVDPGEENIVVAREHAQAQGLDIEYIVGTTDDLAAAGRTFDCVNALEVLEHVPDMTVFLKGCAALIAPGGLFITSTISRTLKSFALAIVAAEYVLNWVPRGTHEWSR